MKKLFVGLAVLFFVSNSAMAKCIASADFLTVPKTKRQTLEVATNVTLDMAQTISTQTVKGAKVATNVICQTLNGASYTGSKEEWQGFIDSAIKGLLAKNFKNVSLTMLGEGDTSYKGSYPNKEYIFTATTPSGTQSIYNLAVLDKENNAFYTLSVSGDNSVHSAIKNEYERVVSTFSLQ